MKAISLILIIFSFSPLITKGAGFHVDLVKNKILKNDPAPSSLRSQSNFFQDTMGSLGVIDSVLNPQSNVCNLPAKNNSGIKSSYVSCEDKSKEKQDFLVLSVSDASELPEAIKERFIKSQGEKELGSLKGKSVTLMIDSNQLKKAGVDTTGLSTQLTAAERKSNVKRAKREGLKLNRQKEICDSTLGVMSKNDNLMPFMMFLGEVVDAGNDKDYTHSQEVKLSKAMGCKVMNGKTTSKHIEASITSALITKRVGRTYEGCKGEGSKCKTQYPINETDARIGITNYGKAGGLTFSSTTFAGVTYYDGDPGGLGSSIQKDWHNNLNFLGGAGSAIDYVNQASDISLANVYAGLGGKISQAILMNESCLITFFGEGSILVGNKSGFVTSGSIGVNIAKRVGAFNLSAFASAGFHRSKSMEAVVGSKGSPFASLFGGGESGDYIEVNDDPVITVKAAVGVGISDGLNSLNIEMQNKAGPSDSALADPGEDDRVYSISYQRRTGVVPGSGPMSSMGAQLNQGVNNELRKKKPLAYSFSGKQ